MSETNTTLKEAFLHHTWATRRLLAFCAQLSDEQMRQARQTPLAGTVGSVLETFDHVVRTDGGYLASLTGRRAAWAGGEGMQPADLRELSAFVDEAEAMWLEFLSQPDDAARIVHLDKGTYETRAAIVIAQALHHGSAHREQICAILREMGFEPPEIQPWDFADETGRSKWVKAD